MHMVTIVEATDTVREYFSKQCALGLSEFVILGCVDDPRTAVIVIRCRERCIFDDAARAHEVFVLRADGVIKAIRPFAELPPQKYLGN